MTRDEAARQVSQAVADLFFSAENQLRFIGAADELGLTPPMLKHLLTLEPGPERSMRELADQWRCDASFVTVVVDGLEARGYVERRVAPFDRRIKTVRVTEAGEAARARAAEAAYGPRAGFDALTAREQVTLANLLTKMVEAQAAHDATLLDQPDVRSAVRRGTTQRTREFRPPSPGAGWRQHFDAHREELLRLKEELARVRDEVKAQARRPVDEAKAAKAEIKDTVAAELKARRDELRGRGRG